MNRNELDKILEAHRLWQETGGREGTRADLARANLARANLARANLADADLAHANLADADLAHANLAGANLARADLARANGCILLTETDHGYRVVAGWIGGEWRIWAGCRDFTVTQARAHWGAPDYHLPQSGSRIVALLDWLEKQPTPVEVAR